MYKIAFANPSLSKSDDLIILISALVIRFTPESTLSAVVKIFLNLMRKYQKVVVIGLAFKVLNMGSLGLIFVVKYSLFLD